ncbi:hypothetical protein WN943_003949 [Citrus x changshan-huyou]
MRDHAKCIDNADFYANIQKLNCKLRGNSDIINLRGKKMSEKSSRHQRRPSQGVFINFDDLSSPISDNVAGAPDQPQAQPSDDNQIRAPLPPSSAPAPGSVIVKDDGKEKPRDVKN